MKQLLVLIGCILLGALIFEMMAGDSPDSLNILGIEDPTGRIGMMMVTAGVGIMAIAIVLIVRRELKK